MVTQYRIPLLFLSAGLRGVQAFLIFVRRSGQVRAGEMERIWEL